MHAAADFKRPESVLVVVHTPALDCLLLERVQPQGFWQSVTGTLRWDEMPAECAAREIDEETGLPAAVLRDARVQQSFPILPAWRSRYAPDVASNLEHLFYLEVPEVQPVRLAPAEHVAYLWLPVDAAIEKVASWTNRDALQRLKDSLRA
jgi:dihydroneopterin triphosphate diphosphatase